ncbi:MAG TPA: DUF5989 family protein [Candidatus Sumerlaeota bacterium]|nr:DUF5989 family protein [Candidatus Sumerlaeota bacterium]
MSGSFEIEEKGRLMADSQFDRSESDPACPGPSARRRGVVGEFWDYLMQNKKWWMLPILILFLVFGLLLVLGVHFGGALPFIYALF